MDVPLTKTAYDDTATRWAWRRTAAFRLCTFLLSYGSFVLWLYVVVMTPVWTLWVLMPALFVLIYVAMLNTVRFSGVLSLRRVLRVYPWQSVPGAASTAKNGTTRFSFADPEQPDKQVSLRYGDWLGSGYTFWVRKVRSGGVDEVWFAGDPRFLGVVAVPGPRRLLSVAQREAVDDRMSARKRGVSPEARERARAAGARVG
ncbi:hypothetical protein [Streptomyces poonensis]|uniref:Uncharacterized protein n=1 Tax=Streptomyces poonensis TaxID=68255 RepID=A0A918QAL8_9ACTN|nr:hypothetical protein [Streptomyces poonensis]GGZ39157.1 hypothetical protein GCM10010365_69870 [Streptomyces poonensis]GLJ93121.1 hypothetical protein GCM10017589_57330 [Streptomyces poonensis]